MAGASSSILAGRGRRRAVAVAVVVGALIALLSTVDVGVAASSGAAGHAVAASGAAPSARRVVVTAALQIESRLRVPVRLAIAGVDPADWGAVARPDRPGTRGFAGVVLPAGGRVRRVLRIVVAPTPGARTFTVGFGPVAGIAHLRLARRVEVLDGLADPPLRTYAWDHWTLDGLDCERIGLLPAQGSASGQLVFMRLADWRPGSDRTTRLVLTPRPQGGLC